MKELAMIVEDDYGNEKIVDEGRNILDIENDRLTVCLSIKKKQAIGPI